MNWCGFELSFKRCCFFMGDKMRWLLLQVLLMVLLLPVSMRAFTAECEIKMVFKMGGKPPLINKYPDNTGLFQDLYTRAAEKIGCTLSITRRPKQRVHRGLEAGKYDFYPAASFSLKRAIYLGYMENGLETGEYGITASHIADITDIRDLARIPDMFWLMEANSSKRETAETIGVPSLVVDYLNIDEVLKHIRTRKQFNYFYVADKEVIDNFVARHQKPLSSFGLKVHQACCGGNKKMYLAFSRFSKHYVEEPNVNYDSSLALSASNLPTQATKGSIAGQFNAALIMMQKSGEITKIFNKWHTK